MGIINNIKSAVNATFSAANIISTYSRALNNINDLLNSAIISEKAANFAYIDLTRDLKKFLGKKHLAFVVDDCTKDGTPTKYSVCIFDNADDCRYYLDGTLTESKEVSIDDFVELAPYDWSNINKYELIDGVVTFHNYAD
ncbi:MAG: hypothetical protein NC452_15705 [Eubacterium sp.]|nr:hypothetical protein [Eubacterium sp.]